MQQDESHSLYHFVQLDEQGSAAHFSWDPDQRPVLPAQGWVHCNYEDDTLEPWLRQNGLEPLVVEGLLAEDTRPCITFFDQGVLVMLRGVNKNPGNAPEDMVSIRMWLEPDRLVSLSRRRLASVAEVLSQLQRGQGPRNAVDLFMALISRLEWHVSQMIDNYQNQIDGLEDQLETTGGGGFHEQLNELRRRLIPPRRFLAPQRDALAQLAEEPPSWFNDANIKNMRELRNRLQRHLEDLDAVRDRAIVIQELLQSQLAEQLNERMYRLNLVAAVFLPLSFFTGLFGINLAGIPGAEQPQAFMWFSGTMLLIGVVIVIVFYRKRWF